MSKLIKQSKHNWKNWPQNQRLAFLKKLQENEIQDDLRIYQTNPVGYIRDILGLQPWHVQEKICKLLLQPPYRVLVKAGHSVGKTWLSACLTSWWYDVFPVSCVITTAPTHRDVCDLLWREVRLLRKNRGGFVGTTAPELRSGPDHYAKGFTASKGESFQGRHQERMLFVFDEAVGVAEQFWQTTKSMFKADGRHGWVAIFNPTDASSWAAQEERLGGWHVVQMSALDHPNIAAELAGQTQPFPAAVSFAQVEDWLRSWAEPIEPEDKTVTDLEWPPNSGKWLRPGPLCESRVLGRWPSQSAYSVWSDGLWANTIGNKIKLRADWPVQIGCDVARFGDDYTVIHIRKGQCSIHHESHNGWDTARTAGRLKQLCAEHATERQPRHAIPVLIDVGGIGAGVVDHANGEYNWVGVNSSENARMQDRYFNVRSELWFNSSELAKKSLIDVSRLPQNHLQELGRQLLAPTYSIDPIGRLRVEEKDLTKKRIKCSPDAADAFNLAYLIQTGQRDRITGSMG